MGSDGTVPDDLGAGALKQEPTQSGGRRDAIRTVSGPLSKIEWRFARLKCHMERDALDPLPARPAEPDPLLQPGERESGF